MFDPLEQLGNIFRNLLTPLEKLPWVKTIRGKGLLNAIEIDPKHPRTASEICLNMAKSGLLAKPTHGHMIRFAPPLVISETDLRKGCDIILSVFQE